MTTPSYSLTLGKTYYEKGFFNLGVEVSRFVRIDDGPAVLLADDGKRRFDVRVDRGANPLTGAPRVFGGARLRDWFQSRFRLGDVVEVRILGPAEFQLLVAEAPVETDEATPDPSPAIPSTAGAAAPPTMDRGRDALAALRAIGFVDAGRWELAGTALELILSEIGESERALYAFVSDDIVLYIGKTARKLKQRLYSYGRPGATQPTNLKANALIRDILENGGAVQILGFADPETLWHAGFRVNLAAGLEDELIATYKPPWNKAGV